MNTSTLCSKENLLLILCMLALFLTDVIFTCNLQVKYFDSGDYNMAKSNSRTGPNPLLGKAIPTAEAVTQRKHSTACKSKLADGEEHSPSAVTEPVFFADAEGVQTDENQDQTESR